MIKTFSITLEINFKSVTSDLTHKVLSKTFPAISFLQKLDWLENEAEQNNAALICPFEIEQTEDADWNTEITLLNFPINAYPNAELILCDQISSILNCNCLCDAESVIHSLPDHDPFYALARIDNNWFLADTTNLKFHGFTSNGGKSLILIRKLNVEIDNRKRFNYNG